MVWSAWGLVLFAKEKFFLQEIVSAADHYYALRTSVGTISFWKVARLWGARSAGAGGLSSNMGQFCWLDRPGLPSYLASATSRICRPIRNSGQPDWWNGSRRASN